MTKDQIVDILFYFQRRRAFRRGLQLQIDACQTIEELRILVHLTQNKDELMDRAFCKKLEQLEAQGQVF